MISSELKKTLKEELIAADRLSDHKILLESIHNPSVNFLNSLLTSKCDPGAQNQS